MFTVEESARRIGHYIWAELALFETLGQWIPTVTDPVVKNMLAGHCNKHAWHAELWRERLPDLRQADAASLVVAPNASLEEFVAAFRSPADDSLLERLVGTYRVFLPRLAAAYEHHRSVTDATLDASTVRTLRFVLLDDHDDWHEGESVVQRLLQTPDDVSRASAHQATLESLIVQSGGFPTP